MADRGKISRLKTDFHVSVSGQRTHRKTGNNRPVGSKIKKYQLEGLKDSREKVSKSKIE